MDDHLPAKNLLVAEAVEGQKMLQGSTVALLLERLKTFKSSEKWRKTIHQWLRVSAPCALCLGFHLWKSWGQSTYTTVALTTQVLGWALADVTCQKARGNNFRSWPEAHILWIVISCHQLVCSQRVTYPGILIWKGRIRDLILEADFRETDRVFLHRPEGHRIKTVFLVIRTLAQRPKNRQGAYTLATDTQL